MSVRRGVVNVIQLTRKHILQQLLVEEALLRSDGGNWIVLNDGCPDPAIVMGISGNPPALINIEPTLARGVPVIKRFSGGGTVIVDSNTLFATLIFREDALPEVAPYPRNIMHWSEQFYSPVFQPYGAFRLEVQDYVFGRRKFGGNAQSITRFNKVGRWLHHTSFLWDYNPLNMSLLQMPDRVPEYREGRAHDEFLCTLKEYQVPRDMVFSAIVQQLERLGFEVRRVEFEEAEQMLQRDYLRSTVLVNLQQFV